MIRTPRLFIHLAFLGLPLALMHCTPPSSEPPPKETSVERPLEAPKEAIQEAHADASFEGAHAEPASLDGSAEGKKEGPVEAKGGDLSDTPEAPETPEERADHSPDAQAKDAGDEGMPERRHEAPHDAPTDLCAGLPVKTTWDGDTVTVTCTTKADGTRAYSLETTHALRDNDPPSKQVQIAEKPDQPRLRSGHRLLDALFAMTLEEARQNSVQAIYEGGFNGGKPVTCACFQTGAKWTWAWTRDTAYAVDLALAWLDPERSEATLRFKLSPPKPSVSSAGGTQIVQDTGTGGAWPVSTDRVIWALAARKLSFVLEATKRAAFLQAIYPALTSTIAQDRLMIFDTSDGLYRGEQSFLDWREQSYPAWVREDLAHIAMSKALSTNVAHFILLAWAGDIAADLQKPADAAHFAAWASSLKAAIYKELYRPADGLFSTFKTTLLDPAPVAKFDLLGQALADLEGIGSAAERLKALEVYPVSPVGPPVIWPQQPLIPIYHNRAIWPFVTAYWGLAAREAGHAESAAHSLLSLVRGAALNLSNMENLEWMTGKNYVADGPYSGPVVNSRRQLWSVAGFLSAIVGGLGGLEFRPQGLRVRPFIPASIHREGWVQGAFRIEGLPYQGRTLAIEIRLPSTAGQSGAYALDRIELDGSTLADPLAWIAPSRLKPTSTFVVHLRDPKETARPLTIVRDTGDFRTLWSPREPIIRSIQKAGTTLALDLDAGGETGILLDVYRDGQRVATQIPPGLWVDPGAKADSDTSFCYTAESSFPSSKTRSQHARPRCWKGSSQERETVIDAWSFEAKGGTWQDHPVEAAYTAWGERGDALTVYAFHPRRTGRYYADLLYRNPAGPRNTGITCAVKRLQVFEIPSGMLLATHFLAMPHTEQTAISESTGAWLDLDAKKTYRFRIDEAPDTLHNMSFLSHFSIFDGKGGGAAPWNQAEITGLRLFAKEAKEERPAIPPLLAFDGKSDYDKFPVSQGAVVGVPLVSWERFALAWDEEWLSIAVVSQGFEADLKAYLVYLEASKGAWPPAQGSQGMTYLQQTPFLPFTPTHAIAVRYKANNQDGFGPWNGLWRKEAGGWALQQRLRESRSIWFASDRHTIAYRIHRGQLGWPDRIRLAGHLVHATPGHEWKGLLPSTHTPWAASASGFYEIILGQNQGAVSWGVR